MWLIYHYSLSPREFTAAMNWRCSCMVQLSLDFLRSCISVTVPLVVSLVALSSVAVVASVIIPVILVAHVEAGAMVGGYET